MGNFQSDINQSKRIILEQKLSEIDQVIRENYPTQSDIGLLTGLPGLALFQFYYAKYLNNQMHSNIGVDIITKALELINEGNNFPTFCGGIAGFGWVYDHIEQEKLAEAEADQLLTSFDTYMHQVMVKDFNEKNYDFLHGGIGYGFYFLNRFKNTKEPLLKKYYQKIIMEFIDLLEGLAEEAGSNKLKWLSTIIKDADEKGYNFSLSHGMSSIIGILTKFHEIEVFRKRTESILKSAISFIRDFKNENGNSIFPSYASLNKTVKKSSRLAWCYGDLGIGIRFWFAAKTLKDKELEGFAILMLKHSALRTDPKDTLVLDAGICHGSFGNAQIFNRIYRETGNQVFKTATHFWINDGLNKATFKDGLTGFKQWNGTKFINEIPLLEGISGIGLVVLDYLSIENNTWDECLMIS